MGLFETRLVLTPEALAERLQAMTSVKGRSATGLSAFDAHLKPPLVFSKNPELVQVMLGYLGAKADRGIYLQPAGSKESTPLSQVLSRIGNQENPGNEVISFGRISVR